MLAFGADLMAVLADGAGTGYAFPIHLARGSDAGDAVADAAGRQELRSVDSLLVIIFQNLLVGSIEEHGQGFGVDGLHAAGFDDLVFL